jgi:Mannosyltransferase (PIG-V)
MTAEPRGTRYRARPGRGLVELAQTDREILLIWLASRVSMFVVAGAVGWLFVSDDNLVVSWLNRWERWDFIHFRGIAEFGYGGEPTGVPNEAFFPGLPALLWLGGLIGLPYVLTGLLVSLIAGGVAALALGRLADLEGGPGTGRLAVVAWVFAPAAVFLAAPYTESLFLGLAIPAWLAARRGRWAHAGILAAVACTVRVSGVFLVAALAVEWLTARYGGRAGRSPTSGWSEAGWLLLPALPLAAWMSYLRWRTGDWLAWLNAQAQEWNREFTWPWDAWVNTWNAAFGGGQNPGFVWMFRAEIVAILIGVLLTAALLWWRRWGEATWVGLQVVAFATSFWFFSVPRATLLWWPLWIAFAILAARRRWVLWAYLAVSVPLMAVWAATFLTHRWAG